jgi:hypothetical protein
MAVPALMLRRNMPPGNAPHKIAVILRHVIDTAPGLANPVRGWLAVEDFFLGGAT